MDQQMRTLQALVGQAGTVAIATVPAAAQHACPECGKPMQRRKGTKGFFWGCTGYPDCKTTLPDVKGKPGKRSAVPGPTRKADVSAPGRAGETCPTCGKGSLVLRSTKGGKNPGSAFLGCSRFPECKHFEWVK